MKFKLLNNDRRINLNRYQNFPNRQKPDAQFLDELRRSFLIDFEPSFWQHLPTVFADVYRSKFHLLCAFGSLKCLEENKNKFFQRFIADDDHVFDFMHVLLAIAIQFVNFQAVEFLLRLCQHPGMAKWDTSKLYEAIFGSKRSLDIRTH